MALSQKNTGGTAARSNRPGGEAKKPEPSRSGLLGRLLPKAPAGSSGSRPSGLTGLRARFSGVTDWFRSVASELRKVTWPTREVVRNLTIIVIAVSTAVGAFLGALDYLFKLLFEQLLR